MHHVVIALVQRIPTLERQQADIPRSGHAKVEGDNQLAAVVGDQAVSAFEPRLIKQVDLATDKRMAWSRRNPHDASDSDARLQPHELSQGDRVLKPDDPVEVRLAGHGEGPATDPAWLVEGVGVGGQAALEPALEVHLEPRHDQTFFSSMNLA